MLKWINKKRNKKGFTLIELVIVIAILGILIAIAAPRLLGFRDTAAKRADEATAATIAKAAEMYVASNNIKTSDISTEENGNVSIARLYNADLLDTDYSSDFTLTWDGNKFVVTKN